MKNLMIKNSKRQLQMKIDKYKNRITKVKIQSIIINVILNSYRLRLL